MATGRQRGTGLGARLRGAFDRTVAAGPLALIAWLALVALGLVLAAAALLMLPGLAPDTVAPRDFGDAVWRTLGRLLSADIVGGAAGWPVRAVLLAVTLGGVLLFAMLVAGLTLALGARRDGGRQKRDRVEARDHVVILNWTPALFAVIDALVAGHAARRPLSIVVLADRDAAPMAHEIARRGPDPRRARVICHVGDPTDPADLARVASDKARAVIVLSPDGDPADARVLRSVLALAAPHNIVAQIQGARTAALVGRAGGGTAQPVRADEFRAHLLAHAAGQPGLAAVQAALLTDLEIVTAGQPAIEGTSFGDALMAYDAATLIGLTDSDGKVWLDPPMETAIQPGMEAVLLAPRGDAAVVTTDPANVDNAAIAFSRRAERPAERTLLLGWNRRAPRAVFELSRRAGAGSLLTIAADTPGLSAAVDALTIAGNSLQVEYGIVDTTNGAALEGLDIPSYGAVLVLAASDGREADTATLATLLHLREIIDAAGTATRLVAELNEAGARDLAASARAEIVVGSELAGLMLARTSERGGIAAFFADLLDEQGAQVALRPVEAYLELGQPMTFYTVTEACRRRGEVAIGHLRPRPEAPGAGIGLNPRKSEIVTYEPGDRLVVLSHAA